MSGSRSYSHPEIKKLFALSFNQCALPGCEQPLASPEWPKVMAEICHIYGLKPGSARHEPTIPAEELNRYENLLLLCRNCHQTVDVLEVAKYTADDLLEIKRSHEERRGGEGEWCSNNHLEDLIHRMAMTLQIELVGGEAPAEGDAPTPVDSAEEPAGSSRNKIRVYELARELGLTNKECLDLCAKLGIGVKSHSSSVEEAQGDRVRRKAERDGLIRDVQPPEPNRDDDLIRGESSDTRPQRRTRSSKDESTSGSSNFDPRTREGTTGGQTPRPWLTPKSPPPRPESGHEGQA
jgi:translation initiation factor IF-2